MPKFAEYAKPLLSMHLFIIFLANRVRYAQIQADDKLLGNVAVFVYMAALLLR